MTRFVAGAVMAETALGDVRILEAHEATENSPEQYVVQLESGEIHRVSMIELAAAAREVVVPTLAEKLAASVPDVTDAGVGSDAVTVAPQDSALDMPPAPEPPTPTTPTTPTDDPAA